MTTWQTWLISIFLWTGLVTAVNCLTTFYFDRKWGSFFIALTFFLSIVGMMVAAALSK